MLQGRTFSYSDTQRYRVGSNYLQLPINAPKTHVATNQRDGQMAYRVDTAPGSNPHVNYEPSSLNGLQEAPKSGADHEPEYKATKLMRRKIDRTNDFKQAGERWNLFEDWERDDLINNLVANLVPAAKHIQEKMIENFTKADPVYGQRLADGLKAANAADFSSGPIGSTNSAEAVKQAEDTAHEAKPY
jgi:catalase